MSSNVIPLFRQRQPSLRGDNFVSFDDSSSLLTVVNYNLTVGEMYEAGQYDKSNLDVTSHQFSDRDPIIGQEGEVEYENRIFSLYSASWIEAWRSITTADRVHPWEPWRARQTLAFGATFPQQRKCSVVGLGSFCEVRGYEHVLILPVKGGVRLDSSEGCWIGHYGFGAARRVSNR